LTHANFSRIDQGGDGHMITADHLSKHFGGTVVVDDLSFTVQPGRVTCFLGPNGAGKSTTLRMILGLDTPTSGNAAVNGQPYRSLERPLRVVGSLLDAADGHEGRTGRNHLRWLAESNGLPTARVTDALAMTGMTSAANRRIRGYSLGMKQRLGLAAALIGDPAVLVLDEPTNGLDPQGIQWLRDLLRALAGEGRTVFVSSHLLTESALLADQVIVIGAGRLLADLPLDQVPDREGAPGGHEALAAAYFELTGTAVQYDGQQSDVGGRR
jgi:ABC-2 type transport system ATP-binding protein